MILDNLKDQYSVRQILTPLESNVDNFEKNSHLSIKEFILKNKWTLRKKRIISLEGITDSQHISKLKNLAGLAKNIY